MLWASAAFLLCGCGSTGDQTSSRLKDMNYTVENLASEVAGRLKEADRRSALRETPAARPSRSDDAGRSDGPGGNPFSIDEIGKDVAIKLSRIKNLEPQTALNELAALLKDRGVEATKVEALVAAATGRRP
jgi:hypothetical protein